VTESDSYIPYLTNDNVQQLQNLSEEASLAKIEGAGLGGLFEQVQYICELMWVFFQHWFEYSLANERVKSSTCWVNPKVRISG